MPDQPPPCPDTLTIGAARYTLTELPPTPGPPRDLSVLRTYRLVPTCPRPGNRPAYDVTLQTWHEFSRAACSCPDFTYRRAPADDTLGCKHIRALRALGLI